MSDVDVPWWKSLYALQHRVWPGWADSDGGAAQKVDFILDWLGLADQAEVVDIGCGSGRELQILTQRGYRCCGVDVNEELLERARHRLGDLATEVHLICQDYRSLVLEHPFDLGLMLDSTANIFPAPTLSQAVVGLAKAGVRNLFIDQMNPLYWDKEHPLQRIESPEVGPGFTERQYSYDPNTGILTDRCVIHGQGEGAFELPTQSLHLLQPNAWVDLLTASGYAGVEVVGSQGFSFKHPAGPPDSESAFLAVKAHLS